MITNTKLDPIETASVDELQALQTQRLKWTLKHAYENVPMYRRKFDAAGVHPDDFRELSDLRKFPCTTKQDLRIFKADEACALRIPQQNPDLSYVYDNLLKGRAHELLHIHYPAHGDHA